MDSSVTVESDGRFRLCGHHHVPGEEGVSLMTVEEGKGMIRRDDAVLLGWSQTHNFPLVTSEDEETSAAIITMIDIPEEDTEGFDDQVSVYAVWAEDKNHNSQPDYKELHYILTYNANGGSGEPEKQENILTNTSVTLSNDKPTRAGAVFLGWSETAVQSEPYTSAPSGVTLHQPNTPMTITGDVTLYAVWAVNKNGNTLPDYADPITVRYDSYPFSGSVSNVPGDELHNYIDSPVTLSRMTPAHDPLDGVNVVFVGWSSSIPAKIYERADRNTLLALTRYQPGATYMLPGDGRTTSVTLYAVWARDANHNGQADALETRYTLTYDTNGGTSVPGPVTDRLEGDSVTLTFNATYAASDKSVILAGWTTQEKKFNSIITWDSGHADKESINGQLVGSSYIMPDHDVTLYAAWAADANGNDTPDYRE